MLPSRGNTIKSADNMAAINMKLLITTFEAFGNDTENSSAEAAKLLPEQINGWDVVRRTLPVTYDGSIKSLYAMLDEISPDAVVCLGQAGGRAHITPELAAVNFRDAAIPDNDGVFGERKPVIPGAPDGYLTRLPVFEMVEGMKKAGIPAQVSTTAGTYVCNNVMFALLHRVKGIPAGFIHVPYMPSQVKDNRAFSLESDKAAEGLRICVETITKMKK